MEHMFAPWRIEYIKMPKQEGCIFCTLPKEKDDEKNLILYRGTLGFVIMNNYPYNPGHLMVAPYRHVPSLEDLTDDEAMEIYKLVKASLGIIRKVMTPHGFNMGINMGRVAGAGIVDHMHVHIVPRWNGDTNFMPVLSDTRVVPQALQETYKELRKEFEKLSIADF
ncbi:MAG: HIT domain-containing protein [Euryarchaeota archaeon]|nr:HIT domain-containing protein [Euryarchaeota archaeon]